MCREWPVLAVATTTRAAAASASLTAARRHSPIPGCQQSGWKSGATGHRNGDGQGPDRQYLIDRSKYCFDLVYGLFARGRWIGQRDVNVFDGGTTVSSGLRMAPVHNRVRTGNELPLDFDISV
jgi:hypothetical protein